MFKSKECVAMLLAGGQGSRLYALTQNNAKPAVTFGGKYRIIDFPLSNCANSRLDTVGVLTQYSPLMLNEYIGTGLPWDLDRNFGGVRILPPYQRMGNSDWYRGTANAIYQNIEFIKRYSPKYVLILSGDHIYKMNYSEMLAAHKASNAECSIAVIDVPAEDASRFGVVSVDSLGFIESFIEKPKEPVGTKASMGIYIFNTQTLFEYLRLDDEDAHSSNDFGKNIIPKMLAAGERLFAYSFNGYWKDVGTVQSLWEANMDLLGEHPRLTLGTDGWQILSRHGTLSPQYIGDGAKISNSLITDGCNVLGEVTNSILGENVTVCRGAKISDSVIMSGTVIEEDASVSFAIIDSFSKIGKRSKVGARDGSISVIGESCEIGDDSVVCGGAMIYRTDNKKAKGEKSR